MGDQHQRRAQTLQLGFQPFDGRQIEMVGGLVEEQDVGPGRQSAGERGAAPLPAGEMGGVLLARQAELAQQGEGAGVHHRRGPGPPPHRRARDANPASDGSCGR